MSNSNDSNNTFVAKVLSSRIASFVVNLGFIGFSLITYWAYRETVVQGGYSYNFNYTGYIFATLLFYFLAVATYAKRKNVAFFFTVGYSLVMLIPIGSFMMDFNNFADYQSSIQGFVGMGQIDYFQKLVRKIFYLAVAINLINVILAVVKIKSARVNVLEEQS
ncbi:MAG: hypothetical protein AAGU27_16240 [Dehalobacterium sp.]